MPPAIDCCMAFDLELSPPTQVAQGSLIYRARLRGVARIARSGFVRRGNTTTLLNYRRDNDVNCCLQLYSTKKCVERRPLHGASVHCYGHKYDVKDAQIIANSSSTKAARPSMIRCIHSFQKSRRCCNRYIGTRYTQVDPRPGRGLARATPSLEAWDQPPACLKQILRPHARSVASAGHPETSSWPPQNACLRNLIHSSVGKN